LILDLENNSGGALTVFFILFSGFCS